jgi:hypothetical protein
MFSLPVVIAAIARASKPEPQYRYRSERLHYTSATLGPCDVCGGRVKGVWRQTEDHREIIDGVAHYIPGETKFGHEACLVSVRRA